MHVHLIACVPAFSMLSVHMSHLIACVPTPTVPSVCVLHLIVCQHSLLCYSNSLIGVVIAVNYNTASGVFLLTLEVLTL